MGYSLVIAEWLCGMTLREARPLGNRSRLRDLLRRRDAPGLRHGHLQAGRPGTHRHEDAQERRLARLGPLLPDGQRRRVPRAASGGLPSRAEVGIRLPRLLGRHHAELRAACFLFKEPARGLQAADESVPAAVRRRARTARTAVVLLHDQFRRLLADVLPVVRHPAQLHRRLGRFPRRGGRLDTPVRRRPDPDRQRRQPHPGVDPQLQRAVDQHFRVRRRLCDRPDAIADGDHRRDRHFRRGDLRPGDEHERMVDARRHRRCSRWAR